MAVPDLARIEAIPCCGNELVTSEVRRKRGSTGIPETLLGPKAPGGDAGGRGGAAGQKT
jgi:hypothetical protein